MSLLLLVPAWLGLTWLLAAPGESLRDLWFGFLFIVLYNYLNSRYSLDWWSATAVVAISVLGVWEGRGRGR